MYHPGMPHVFRAYLVKTRPAPDVTDADKTLCED